MLDSLVGRGVLRREEDGCCGSSRAPGIRPPHGVEPPAETAARQRMVAAVAGDGPVEPRTAALCALVRASGWTGRCSADLDREQVKERLKEIAEGDWAADRGEEERSRRSRPRSWSR